MRSSPLFAFAAVLSLLISGNSPQALAADCGPALPDKLAMHPGFFSGTASLKVFDKATRRKLGSVDVSGLSALIELRGGAAVDLVFHGTDGRKLVHAVANPITGGRDVVVSDCGGDRIGRFRESVLSSIFAGPYANEFNVYDAQGALVAKSTKTEFGSPTFYINDLRGQRVAMIERPAFGLDSESWKVTVARPGVVDTRLLLIMAGFKSASDRARGK